MLDTYFKNYFWSFYLLVIFAAAFLLAKTANVFVGNALSTPPEKLAQAKQRPNRPKAAAQSPAGSITAFLDRNLFKAAREDLTPEPETEPDEAEDVGEFDPDKCEASTLGARLLATFVSTDPQSSMAVFEDTGKSEVGRFFVGDKVLDQAEIVSVEWRSVLVKRSGRCEKFALDTDATPSASAAPTPPVSRAAPAAGGDSEFGKGVKKLTENEYEIPRGEIDNVLSNLNQIATQARIVPSFHNGKANGFKLFSIRPGSLYSKIGIQNGDIIQRINGYEINSPDKALEIYSKLKDATSITVDLTRRGKTKTLSYGIR